MIRLGITEAVELTKTVTELVKKGVTLELQERIAELREAVLNVKDEVLSLREQNQDLRAKLAAQESWEARAAGYKLITAPGGALVRHSPGPPEHYACPRCYEAHKISILQDRRVMSGAFDCKECSASYNVKLHKPLPPIGARGDWS